MNASLIELGLYTVGDAARLLRVSERKVRGWIGGYQGAKTDPIIRNDVGWLDGKLAFSFANLMEVRFIQHFAGLKVSVRGIREMAREAEQFLKHPHPFATNTVFKTDGRKIFAEAAKRADDKALYDLKAKNWAMLDIIAQSLNTEIAYDPAGDARMWTPRPEIASVVIRPRVAFGQPVLKEEEIPTRTLYEAFQAEDDNFDSVARWYKINPARVREAVSFEVKLRMAA